MKSALVVLLAAVAIAEKDGHVTLGPRPFWLLKEMRSNSVKETLRKCFQLFRRAFVAMRTKLSDC